MAAFAAVDRAAILTDPQGRVRLANHACARLLGRAPRSLVGADAGDLMQVDGRERKLGWFVVPLPSGGPTHGWSLVVTGSAPDESDATAWSTTSTGGQPSQTDWATILALLSRVHPAATLPETSQLICDAVRETTDLDGAMIILMPENSDFVHVSNSGPELPGFSTGSTFPLENVAPIMEITARGPWYLDLSDPGTRSLIDSDLVDTLLGAGLTATAYGGLRSANALLGVLAVASTAPGGPQILASRLPLIEQMARLAGAVLGTQAERFLEFESRHQTVRQVIEGRALRTAFQPVVQLPEGQLVGYEALTRFADGTAPDVMIGEAHSLGLGVELEQACVEIALNSAAQLPAELFLSVNLSPEAVVAGGVLPNLPQCDRTIVVEITEHAHINSYPDVRRALGCQPRFKVAVDDAGAGFASLRHILELAPDYVKLDLGLVRNVDSDPARAALVAGMCHFASATGTQLIAEGVETAAEAQTLCDLGVRLAQGYLFGRPGPL